jgi:hypothetical protein
VVLTIENIPSASVPKQPANPSRSPPKTSKCDVRKRMWVSLNKQRPKKNAEKEIFFRQVREKVERNFAVEEANHDVAEKS